ncbi:eCIS core domain-containing protein [Nostoc sp. NZL]|uniref:eCIS core domain-containing protein n=1 Tax=Nostoc sp. NZL TaxID=2650612 RepID=UPI0018C661B9|nr:DUF4157 domain-containing protein [Nostoc sp. NZL]MBG1241064.1 DUF4157 domain-containing protein [Nostoc sp. NZL]
MSDRTWTRHNAGTSFTNPSLVSSNIPTLANPTRGFGLPTNNTPLATVTEVAGDLQEAQSADEQSLEPEAIKEKPLVHDISRISLRRPQPQLTVSQPGDQYEQSADWVANQIMLLPRPQSKINPGEIDSQDIVQRKCAACEQEEEEVQRASDHSVPTQENIETQLNNSKGGGNPLSAEVRDFMEPRFGSNFDNVRVHTGSNAVQMSQSLGAQAFTHGSDVYFGAGKSPANNELTAHELTHVVQQTGKVQKQNDTSTAPAPVEQTASGMPPKKGTTKIDKKNGTITASGKNITEAITNLTSQGKGEAGSVTCAPEKSVQTYQADDQSAEIVYEADVLVTETKAMPVWTELDQQCEPVKKEWARFYSALDTHENGHISIDEKAFKDLHKKLLGKTTSASDKIFNDTYAQANTDNNTYDTTTKHGLTQGTGVTPVQCGPEKVSQNEDESNAETEVQTKQQAGIKTLQHKSSNDFLSNKTTLQTKLSPTLSVTSQPHSTIQAQPQTNKVQMKCSACDLEDSVQRKTIAQNITSHKDNKSIQKLGWNDIKDAAGAGANWVGDQASAGAEWVGDKASDVASMGKDAFAALVARIAPGLANLIRQGPMGLLGEKIKDGIKSWVSSIAGNIDIAGVIAQLQGSFTGVFEGIQDVTKGDPASCRNFANSLKALQDLGHAFMENAAVKQIQAVFSQVKGVFQKVTDLAIAPAFDALMSVAGGVFDTVKGLATTIWEWGAPVRNTLGAAWDWVKEQLGIGGDGEGGVLGWLKTKASQVWTEIKGTLAPVLGPLKTVGSVLLAFSPVGSIYLIVKYVPQLVKAVQWLWAHKDDKDIVKKAHEEMGDTILPELLSNLEGFAQTMQSTVSSLVNQAVQLSEAVLELLGAISGVPLLSMAQSLVQTVSNGVKEFISWCQEGFQSAAKTVQEFASKIVTKIKPYIGVLTSLGLAIVNPAMIPVILAGWAWQALDDCYKAPIINFLLDIVIGLLQAAPSLPMFGLLWPIIKAGVLGFLQGVKGKPDHEKVAIANKLAKIISGGSPAFIVGFVKGLLKGIWEGLTDPFVLIYEAIKGLGNLVTWLNDVANQALSPTPTDQPASAQEGTASPATAANNNVEMGERMQQMAGELQPPVEQVSQGFMPAVQEVFSGGGAMSFEQLMQKLGDAWGSVETALMNAGGTLADKVCQFMLQDSAEGEMGETVGWLAGTIAFEVVLGILTAGSWTAAKGAMKGLKLFAKILDWTGEAMGLAFKGLAKVGGFILDGIKGLGKLLGKAGGAAKVILDALGEIGQKLITFADELLGRAAKGAASEVAEETGEKAAKEVVEEAGEKATKETVEEAGEKAAKEGAEESGEKGAKETTDDAAKKAAELPAAIAKAKSITETNDIADTPAPILLGILTSTVKPQYSWIKGFEARPKRPGHYSIHMIASDHEIDSDYSTDEIKKLESQAKEFEAQLKEASAKTREAEAKAVEARRTADEATSHVKATEAEAKAAEAKVQQAEIEAQAAEARAKNAEGTTEEAAQAKQELLKAKQEAEQAKQEVLKARQQAEQAKKEFQVLEQAKAKASLEETEARQIEAIAREEASLVKQEALTNQKVKLQGDRAALDKEIDELRTEAAKAQKKVDEASKKIPDKRGAERKLAENELDQLQKRRDKISNKLSEKSGEKAKLNSQIKNIEEQIQAEIRASRAVPPEIAKKLRDNSPNDELRKWVNDSSNPQVKFDPVTGKPIDPVYGRPVDRLSPDHIVPLEEIKQMPGFNKLTYQQQLEVANLRENIMGIDPRVNSAKQDTSWTVFKGHSEFGAIDPKVQAKLIQAEKDARAALEKAIEARLP